MSDIPTLRTAVATAVATISGLRTSAKVPDQISPPIAVVYRKDITYDLNFAQPGSDSGTTYAFGVVVYGGRAAERSTQDYLDNLCESTGSTSIKSAIESNAALHALCNWALVRSAGETQVSTIGQVDYLSVEFTVEVAV